ncbi:MAG: hypothetical protein ABIH46_11295 [Chloroflexota bacterium]
MSEKKRFAILELKDEKRLYPLTTHWDDDYTLLAEVAEAVEKLQADIEVLGTQHNFDIARLDGRINSFILRYQPPIDGQALLETELADLQERIAALEHHIQEDHVQPPEEGLCQEKQADLSLSARVAKLERYVRHLLYRVAAHADHEERRREANLSLSARMELLECYMYERETEAKS